MTGSAAGSIGGKVVVITGAARGIGLAIARRLIADGARVAIIDIDEIAVKAAADDFGVTTYGGVDVTAPDAFGAFLDRVEAELGPLDVLVNNAGVMPIGALDAESDQASRRTMRSTCWA